MKPKRSLVAGAVLVALVVGLGIGSRVVGQGAFARNAVEAPIFEVDPFWPKPLPNHWVLGSVVGLGIDSRDHVFIIHRRAPLNESTEIGASTDPPTGECCLPAPYILEFSPEGDLLRAWGGARRGLHVAYLEPRADDRTSRQRLDRWEREW